MIKSVLFTLLATFVLFLSGCGKRYDYTIHKPKVRYKPSLAAFDKLNRKTLGKRYIWAEERPYKGFDCSGLTYYNYGSMGIDIPRTANEQYHCGTPVARGDLQKGDLVFFAGNLRRPNHATHVGIYLGNGKFQQASSAKRRVVISSLNKPYYRRHYIGARRYYSFNTCNTDTTQRVATITQNLPSVITDAQMLLKSSQNLQSAQANSQKYYISLGDLHKVPSERLTRLRLSGYSTKITHINGYDEVQVGPFATQNRAYSAIDLNPALFGESARVESIPQGREYENSLSSK